MANLFLIFYIEIKIEHILKNNYYPIIDDLLLLCYTLFL